MNDMLSMVDVEVMVEDCKAEIVEQCVHEIIRGVDVEANVQQLQTLDEVSNRLIGKLRGNKRWNA